MDNWFLKLSAVLIAIISYIDSIFSLVRYEQSGTVLTIAIIFILLWSIIARKRKKKIFKWQFPDLFATICFFISFGEKYNLNWSVFPSESFVLDPLSTLFCNIFNGVIYYLIAFFSIVVVLNAVLSSCGWGLTRIVKAALYRIGYLTLYTLLRYQIIYKVFRKCMENRHALTVAECDLLKNAVKKRKEYLLNRKKTKRNRTFWERLNDHFYFPIVLRKHAEKKSFMPKWQYNISLVRGEQVKLKWANKPFTPRKSEFEIDLSNSKLAIINEWGKRFLRDLYRNDRESVSEKNKEINIFLGDTGWEKEDMTLSDELFYRWGSAGTLPVVKWKNENWIAFVYRDIYPKGWNLPLGASECELEKGRPGITAIREMLEELVIFTHPFNEYHKKESIQLPKRREIYHPLLNSIEGETNYRATKRRFYEKQREIIHHTCTIEFDEESSGYNAITCFDTRTSMQIKVKDKNRKVILPENVSTNCMITVDNFEQGIECIKPVYFKLEDENDLRMGEVDFLEEKWINNPIALVKFSALKEYFAQSKEFNEQLANESIYCNNSIEFGEGLSLKSILEKPENYHLFGVHLEDRKAYQRELCQKIKKNSGNCLKRAYHWKENKHLKAQKEYLEEFVKNCEPFFSIDDVTKEPQIKHIDDEKTNPLHFMCPAAWKACYYYFREIYKGETLKTAGE